MANIQKSEALRKRRFVVWASGFAPTKLLNDGKRRIGVLIIFQLLKGNAAISVFSRKCIKIALSTNVSNIARKNVPTSSCNPNSLAVTTKFAKYRLRNVMMIPGRGLRFAQCSNVGKCC